MITIDLILSKEEVVQNKASIYIIKWQCMCLLDGKEFVEGESCSNCYLQYKQVILI